MQVRPGNVLSIAGFDPSAGAGVLADIKTFEQNEVYGFGIVSALTFQNDRDFDGLQWIAFEGIKRQFEVLARRFSFSYVKIGIIENLDTLKEVIDILKQHDTDIRIIWDPVLKASAGFAFHQAFERQALEEVLKDIYLITPNAAEAVRMAGTATPEEAGILLSAHTQVYLTSATIEDGKAVDILYLNGKEEQRYHALQLDEVYAKHGSGCVLSAAVTAMLHKGSSLAEACEWAKGYTHAFLASAPQLTGFHYGIQSQTEVWK